jgi:hypothetical protein
VSLSEYRKDRRTDQYSHGERRGGVVQVAPQGAQAVSEGAARLQEVGECADVTRGAGHEPEIGEAMNIISGKVANAKVAVLAAVDEACRQVEDEGDFVMQPVSRAVDDLIAEVREEVKQLLILAEKSNKDWRWALDQLDAPPPEAK